MRMEKEEIIRAAYRRVKRKSFGIESIIRVDDGEVINWVLFKKVGDKWEFESIKEEKMNQA
jgi:hypothetical protein